MSLAIPNTFADDSLARAPEVNANFSAIANKFSEGSSGIKDDDISTGANINSAIKLSTAAGRRITQAQLEDDSVDARVLKDDATSGSPNAAVNNANHIKDAIITSGKLKWGSVLVAIPAEGSNSTDAVDTGLDLTVIPIVWNSEGSGSGSPGINANTKLHFDTATNKWWIHVVCDSSFGSSGFNLRIHYLSLT